MDKYSGKMKVADLIEANYRLLGVLARVGIDGSFGEKTISEVCIQSGLDPDTIILLCEVYSSPDFKPSMEVLRRCHVGDVLRYLHQSHDYYLSRALVEMEEATGQLLAPCPERRRQVVWDHGQVSELQSTHRKSVQNTGRACKRVCSELCLRWKTPERTLSKKQNHKTVGRAYT